MSFWIFAAVSVKHSWFSWVWDVFLQVIECLSSFVHAHLEAKEEESMFLGLGANRRTSAPTTRFPG